MNKRCVFCGQPTDNSTKAHVVPRCMYDSAITDPKVQRLTVPACKQCNHSWSKDETFFRNLIVPTVATPMTKAIFPKVMESFHPDAPYGSQEVESFKSMCRRVQTPDGKGIALYPGGDTSGGHGPKDDPRITRVVKKIIRGYSYAVKLRWPVPEEKVAVAICFHRLPHSLLDHAHYEHRDPNVFECWWHYLTDEKSGTGWLLRFYRHITFAGFVEPL